MCWACVWFINMLGRETERWKKVQTSDMEIEVLFIKLENKKGTIKTVKVEVLFYKSYNNHAQIMCYLRGLCVKKFVCQIWLGLVKKKQQHIWRMNDEAYLWLSTYGNSLLLQQWCPVDMISVGSQNVPTEVRSRDKKQILFSNGPLPLIFF